MGLGEFKSGFFIFLTIWKVFPGRRLNNPASTALLRIVLSQIFKSKWFRLWLEDAVWSFWIVLLIKETSCREVLGGLPPERVGEVRLICKNFLISLEIIDQLIAYFALNWCLDKPALQFRLKMFSNFNFSLLNSEFHKFVFFNNKDINK